MLKTHSDAQVAKMDKKLKMVDPQLKKQKQDSKVGDGDANVIPAKDTWSLDPNSLLEKLKKLDKYNKDDKDDK